ncbi:hypothetical protein T484DRAFT_1826674, partial [Baffinella frigidus]
ITRKDEKALRTKAATFTTLETRKDGVKFTSPSLKPLADKLKYPEFTPDGVKFTSPSLKPLADKYKALDDEVLGLKPLAGKYKALDDDRS